MADHRSNSAQTSYAAVENMCGYPIVGGREWGDISKPHLQAVAVDGRQVKCRLELNEVDLGELRPCRFWKLMLKT